jgi:glycosyltransferase involved in cell wall biosynthesis
MKILHTVESYFPARNGMSEVVEQLSRRLVQMGHDVTVATSQHKSNLKMHQGVKIERFGIAGNMVRGMTGQIDEYRSFLEKADFDVITNFAAQQWATDITLPLLERIQAKKIFVPTGFSALFDKDYTDYFSKMGSWMKSYDMNVFLSNDYRDVNFAREHNVLNTTVIPNGADEIEFSGKINLDVRKLFGIPKTHELIILVGSHTGLKGHRQAIEIFNRASISNVTLLIIGDLKSLCYYECKLRSIIGSIGNGNKRIIIPELDRKTTIAAYQQADLFLFPSNIECSPIVLFEAAASKTPFLVTDVGNSKEIIEWLESGILLPTLVDDIGISRAIVNPSAEILSDLLLHKPKLKLLAEKGYNNWKQQFTWKIIARRYEKLYLNLLKENNVVY